MNEDLKRFVGFEEKIFVNVVYSLCPLCETKKRKINFKLKQFQCH